jgi:putative endonuclease
MKRFALTSQKGILGERLAERYLRERGFAIVTTNYYQAKGKRQGEIDIVAIKEEILYFIEVKLRQVQSGAKREEVFPEAAVTRAKLARLQRAAAHFLQETHNQEKEYHFGVLAIVYDALAKTAKVRFLQDVFF